MNICIVTQRYPYKDNMEFVFVKKLVDEWAKMGHHCIVIAYFPIQVYLRKHIQYKPYHYRDLVSSEVYVDVYNPRTICIRGAGKLNHLWGGWEPQKAFGRVMRKINIKFDFVYCHFFQPSVNAFLYSKLNGIPFFVATGESTIHALRIPYNSFTLKEYRDFTSGVIAVSGKNKSEACKLGLIDPSKCEIFPNGTDLHLFQRKDRYECRKMLGLPLDPFIVICVGYFCERKGQDRLLKAINNLNIPSIKVIFIGKPSEIENVALDGENILFKGSVPNTVIPDYLNAADVFCLPTQFEGCCNAVIEAMACGSAIISSDCSFNYDVLNSTNALLVNPNSVEGISDAIKKMYEDEKLRALLANKALADSLSLSIQQRAWNILNYVTDKCGL